MNYTTSVEWQTAKKQGVHTSETPKLKTFDLLF